MKLLELLICRRGAAAIVTLVVAGLVPVLSTANPVATPNSEDWTVSDLEFLCGHWNGQALGGDAEETWSTPAAGTMIGMFRLNQDGKNRVIEFITIEDTDDGVIYRFMHFLTNFDTWEEKPLVYRLIELDEGYAVFESSEADRQEHKPKRLTYEITGDDQLEVTVEGWEEDDDDMVLGFSRKPLAVE